MGKIIVPKNHIYTSNKINHFDTITSNTAELNANIDPKSIYTDGYIVVERQIDYSLLTNVSLNTTSSVNYRVNLFSSSSDNNKEVRFIKLTLSNFPTYKDNRTKPTTGLVLTTLTANIKIYKKSSSSSYDCTFTKYFTAVNNSCDLNDTYWLTFDPSNEKYTVSTSEPVLISKAIVPDKDNWMPLSTDVTKYTPEIYEWMHINTGEFCNQPYIGRMISIEKETSSIKKLMFNTTYNLSITTKDKILGISTISLGKFVGASYSGSYIPANTKLTFNIFVNNNSNAAYSNIIELPSYKTTDTPTPQYIYDTNVYIDVINNKTISSLLKAIDAF